MKLHMSSVIFGLSLVVLTWALLVQAVFIPLVPMMWVASGVFAIAEVLREKL